MSALVTVALCDEQGVPLLSREHTGMLYETDLAHLAIAVTKALNVCSPVMWRCNTDAWRKALSNGAQHTTNISDMMAMAESGEPLGNEGGHRWRPDRYYGAPVCELTDGQVMAYDAAQSAYVDKVPKKKQEKQWPKLPTPNRRLR